jgi:hypothetical protein
LRTGSTSLARKLDRLAVDFRPRHRAVSEPPNAHDQIGFAD